MLFTAAAAAVVLQLALLVLPPVHVQLAHPAIAPELHTALSVRTFSKIKSVNTWTTVTGRKKAVLGSRMFIFQPGFAAHMQHTSQSDCNCKITSACSF